MYSQHTAPARLGTPFTRNWIWTCFLGSERVSGCDSDPPPLRFSLSHFTPLVLRSASWWLAASTMLRRALQHCRGPESYFVHLAMSKCTISITTNVRLRRLSSIGKLTWGAKDFSQSADHVHLEWEGETMPKNPILHAEWIGDENHESSVNLAECIKNEDGHVRFMDCF